MAIGVLFCDQVGSTDMLTRLGDQLAEEVRRDLYAALRRAVSVTGGEVVKSSGDGLMVIFRPGAADAIACAELMQRAIGRLGTRDLCAGIALRVGVSYGDAIPEGGDWYGAAVNVAARLCSTATAGQVLASDAAVTAGSAPAARWRSVGALSLKGFPEPVPASALEWGDARVPGVAVPAELDPDGALPLVGRDRDLAVLLRAWDAASEGERRIVLVTGDAGAGATRLLAELASRVAADATVAYGRAGLETTALAQAMRWYAGSQPTSTLGAETGTVAATLAAEVPLVGLRLGIAPGHGGEHRLVEAVEIALQRSSLRVPLLVVLDALDLAHDAELDEVIGIALSSLPSRCLLVCAYRSDDASGATVLTEKLASTAGCDTVSLTPLGAADVAALLRPLVRPDSTLASAELDDLVELTMVETGGNPRSVATVAAAVRNQSHSGTMRHAALRACPYKGLRPFETSDADRFHGRDELVAELVSLVTEHPFTAVVGASGSGKSSLVRAGVLPALAAGETPCSALILTPGADPLGALERAVASVAGSPLTADMIRDDPAALGSAIAGVDGRTVLVVDQLEECFTLCENDDDRRAFLDAITTAPAGGTRVIVTLRGDLYGRAAEHAAVAEALQAGTLIVGPMRRADLRAAVTRPAELAGLRLERGLADLMVSDVAERPGALPLLSHALLETWRRRRGDILTVASYHQAGGATGAIARTADRVFEHLDGSQQAIVRRLCLRLTAPGEGADDTRRRVPADELLGLGDTPAAVRAVLGRLVAARLVTIDGGAAELAHEALLREWPRLRSWIEEDRDELRAVAHLDRAARDWDAAGKPPSELYRGLRLETACELGRSQLSNRERSFLDASLAQQASEIRAQRRINRRLRSLLVGLLILLFGTGVAAAAAAGNASRARQNEAAAVRAQESADRNASEAATNATRARANAEEAKLNATQAESRKQEADANAAVAVTNAEQARLAQVEARENAARAIMQQQAAEVAKSATEVANRQLQVSNAQAEQRKQEAEASAAIATSRAEEARLAQLEARANAARAIKQQEAAEEAQTATDQANRRLQETNGQLDAANGDLEAKTAALASSNEALGTVNDKLLTTNNRLLSANRDLESTRLVALAEAERLKGNLDVAMLLANEAIDTGAESASARDQALAIRTDARYLERFLAGPSITERGAPAPPPGGGPESPSVVVEAGHVAVIAGDSILVWDLAGPDRPPVALDATATGTPKSVAFNRDGSRVVVVSSSTVSVWDSAATTAMPLWSSAGQVPSPVLSPDRTVVALEEAAPFPGDGSRVVLVDLERATVVAQWSGHLVTRYGCGPDVVGPDPRPCEFSPDGRYLLGWSNDLATFVLWDRLRPKLTTTLYTPTGFEGRVPVPRFIGAGGLVLGVPDPSSLVAYDADGTPSSTISIGPGGLRSIAVNQAGTTAVVVDDAGVVTRIDLPGASTTQLTTLDPGCTGAFDLTTVSFSPEGKWAHVVTKIDMPDEPPPPFGPPLGFGPAPPELPGGGGCAVPFEWWLPTSAPSSPPAARDFPFPTLTVARDSTGTERFAIDGLGTVLDLTTGAGDNLGNPCFASRATAVCGTTIIDLDGFEIDPNLRRPTIGTGLVAAAIDASGTTVTGITAGGGRVWIADPRRTGTGVTISSEAFAMGEFVRSRWADLSADGSMLASGAGATGSIHDLRADTTVPLALGPGVEVESASFLGSGRLLVRPIDDGPFTNPANLVVDARTGDVIGSLPPMAVVGTSSGGELLAVAGSTGPSSVIEIRSAEDLHVVATVESPFGDVSVGALELSRDGSLLFVYDGSRIRVVDTRSSTTVADVVAQLPRVFGAAVFSADGSKLAVGPALFGGAAPPATGFYDNVLTLVDVTGNRVVGQEPIEQDGCSVGRPALEFSPDGSLLMAASRLFNPANLAPIGSPLACTAAVAFTGNGTSLDFVTLGPRGGNGAVDVDVHRLPLGAGDLRADACDMAGRNLTASEWRRFLPVDVAYGPTCSQWPAG